MIAFISQLSHDFAMSSITIRRLDPDLKERLRVRAARHGHSMEAEVRQILETTLTRPEPQAGSDLYQRIHARFAAVGGVDLDLPPRDVGRPSPTFE